MKKVLVIQNNSGQDFEFRDILESAGFNIYITENEADGLKIAGTYLPDVIICQLDNNEHELKVIKTLNDNTSTECIPLLIITTTNQSVHTRAAMELGADDVLVKPFNASSLLATVKKRLRKIEIIRANITEKITSADNAFYNHKKTVDHILVKIGSRLKVVEFGKIVCITAFKECTRITTEDGFKIIVRRSMRNWVEMLPPKDFLRIHRGTIINMSFLEKIEKNGFRGYNVYLKNISEPFSMSQRYGNIMRRTFTS